MLGGDAHDAEDIGQQVFLRVWKSAARYEPTAKFTTWLYTITRNLVFNEMRRRKHRPMTSLDAAAATADTAAAASQRAAQFEDHPGARAGRRRCSQAELQQAITAAIARCPRRSAWRSSCAVTRNFPTRKSAACST